MKNLLFLLSFTLVTCITFAQEEANLNIDSICYIEYIDTIKEVYTYNDNQNILTFLYQETDFFGTSPINNLYTYTYDNSDKLINELKQEWSNDDSAWINNHLKSCSYVDNMITYELSQKWENNLWVSYKSYTYTYYNNDLLKSQLEQFRLSGQWVNTWKIEYSINQNNKVSNEIKQIWENNSWVNQIKYSFSYNEFGMQETNLWQYWILNSWCNELLFTNTYDSYGNKLSYLRQIWDNDEWNNEFRDTYTYNENGNRLSWLNQIGTWFGNWENGYLHIYTYDSEGNLIADLIQGWSESSGSWGNSDILEYNYNEIGDLTNKFQREWGNNNSWNDKKYLEYNYFQGKINTQVYAWNGSIWEESINGFKTDIGLNGEYQTTRFASSLSLYYSTISGISDGNLNHLKLLCVFPNPVSSQLKIKINPEDYSTNTTIELINQAGSVVKTQAVATNSLNSIIEMNVADIPSGIYVLTVTDGINHASRKIIISK